MKPSRAVVSGNRKVLVAALVAAPFVVGALLWIYYPAVPKSLLGWILLILLGIPTWMLLEWLGDRVFGAQLFARLGRTSRIALAVPIAILLLLLAAYLVHLGQWAIGGR
ncbi:MAG TPA: hypothetical protein VKB34_21890 [Povalibacter sp.]|nr:hypothetical protein [Povalibacter sp.]